MISIGYSDFENSVKENIDNIREMGKPFQSFSTIDSLRKISYEPTPIVALDVDGWIPDGRYYKTTDQLTDADEVGIWSQNFIPMGGVLNSIGLYFIFYGSQEFNGITLEFDKVPPTDVRISDGSGVDVVINNPDGMLSLSTNHEYNTASLLITVRWETENYLRLSNIRFGSTFIFNPNDIADVSANFAIQPMALTANINTCNVKLKTLATPLFAEKEMLEVHDGNRYIGTFFFSDCKKTAVNEWQIEAESMLSILDDYEFLGDVYVNANFVDIVSNIFEGTDLSVMIEDGLSNKKISGWIPICTKREALQMVCFAVGATINDLYSRSIRIMSTVRAFPENVTEYKEFARPAISTDRAVTGVELEYWDFTQDNTVVTILDTPVTVPTVFRTQEPVHSWSVTGGEIIASSANHIAVTKATKITAKKYIQTQAKHTVQNSGMNVKKVSGVYLVNQNNVDALAKSLYYLLGQSTSIDADLIDMGFEMGNLVTLATHLGNKRGILTDASYRFGHKFNRAKVKIAYAED